MKDKNVRQLQQKWTSEEYSGSLYAEMRKDKFIFIPYGSFYTMVDTICEILDNTFDSVEQKIDFIISASRFSDELSYQEYSQGAYILVESYNYQYNMTIPKDMDDLTVLFANIINRVAALCDYSPFKVAMHIAVVVAFGLDHKSKANTQSN